jgi:hypothetical protein
MVVSSFIGVLRLVRFWLAFTPPQYAALQITPSPKLPHSSFRELLRGISGRFILSLNDRPEVRETFSGFDIEAVETT